MIQSMITFLNSGILWYFIILSFCYLILLLLSVFEVNTRHQEVAIGDVNTLMQSASFPPITVFIPAFNEEENIIDTIYSVLQSHYHKVNIIVINDGSTDGTLNKLIDTFKLKKVSTHIPEIIKVDKPVRACYNTEYDINLLVIDKENGGKSDALNHALNICNTNLFITLDADSLIEPNAIGEIVFHMLSHPNMVAVGGAVYILNGCEVGEGEIKKTLMSYNPISAFQICDYLRSFLFARSGFNPIGGSLVYAGAFTLFNYKAVLNIGGFELHNPSQDFEIITHLHQYYLEHKIPYSIGYTPSAVVWTEVPSTLKGYWTQRASWEHGTLRSLLRHRVMCFNPRYKIVGLFSYPFYLFGETLGPLVEFSAYILVLLAWSINFLDVYWAILTFTICLGFSSFLTMATMMMSLITYNKYQRIRDIFWILFLAIFESVGFRQYQVLCRVSAAIKYGIKSLFQTSAG